MTLRIIFVLAFIGVGYQFFSKRSADKSGHANATTTAAASPAGFVPMRAPANKVLIIAPPDCPREAGQRTAALVSQLRNAGIACELTGHVEFTVSDEADAEHLHVRPTALGLHPRQSSFQPTFDRCDRRVPANQREVSPFNVHRPLHHHAHAPA